MLAERVMNPLAVTNNAPDTPTAIATFHGSARPERR
jgi:hypothetical protein